MDTRTLIRCLSVGATCGLRSMTGPAVVRWRSGDVLRLAFAALAAGELIADKLPAAPPRTIPPALLFRMLAGGFAGASLAPARAGARATGALAGAAGAVLASYGGLALRSTIVKVSGLPDPLVALAEDAIAIAGAIASSRPQSQS